MTRGDKVALGFLSVVFVACAVSLFLPAIQTGEMSRGVLAAFGVPAWGAVVALMTLCALAVLLLFANRARRKRGKGPL